MSAASVTHWIRQLKAGDREAAQQLWQRYFQRLVGLAFQPVMYLIGVPWKEAGIAGGLFGTKIVLNEFVAFIDLGQMNAAALSDRTRPANSRNT